MQLSTKSWFADEGTAVSSQPTTAPGTYTYTGTVSYASGSDALGTTFTVSGSPISITLLDAVTCKGVEDNLPIGATDKFSKSTDEYVYAWAAWEGAQRPSIHALDWGWYQPDGSSYYTYTYSFTPTVSVYYTWAYLTSEYLYDYGTYTVTVHMDGAHVATLTFDFAAGTSSASRAGHRLPSRGGGGGGVLVPAVADPPKRRLQYD